MLATASIALTYVWERYRTPNPNQLFVAVSDKQQCAPLMDQSKYKIKSTAQRSKLSTTYPKIVVKGSKIVGAKNKKKKEKRIKLAKKMYLKRAGIATDVVLPLRIL